LDTTAVTTVLARLLAEYGDGPAEREEIRVWARSGVERLHLADGTAVVFKYAEGPFADEHTALAIAQAAGLPVPERLAVVRTPDLLGMLLTDLGPAERDVTGAEGAALAVTIHQVIGTGALPVLDGPGLAALPRRVASRLHTLVGDSTAVETARVLAKSATERAQGAELPPYGLCHSEWHPTSVHISTTGVHLLDFARAFRGPGLLDLASWHGTITAPDPDHVAATIASYVAAGGPETATYERGGLPAERWALGWHRVWVADWFTHQLAIGWAQGAEQAWITAISRHLAEAADLLNV
jgi:hypothetical protein